jgi:hypothetical protein
MIIVNKKIEEMELPWSCIYSQNPSLLRRRLYIKIPCRRVGAVLQLPTVTRQSPKFLHAILVLWTVAKDGWHGGATVQYVASSIFMYLYVYIHTVICSRCLYILQAELRSIDLMHLEIDRWTMGTAARCRYRWIRVTRAPKVHLYSTAVLQDSLM